MSSSFASGVAVGSATHGMTWQDLLISLGIGVGFFLLMFCCCRLCNCVVERPQRVIQEPEPFVPPVLPPPGEHWGTGFSDSAQQNPRGSSPPQPSAPPLEAVAVQS